MKVKSDWPRRLKDLRAKLGLTQREAARRIGVSREAWIQWESVGGRPSLPMQKLINQFEKYPGNFF